MRSWRVRFDASARRASVAGLESSEAEFGSLMKQLRLPFLLNCVVAGAVYFLLVPDEAAQSRVRDRLTRPIESTPVSALKGNVHALARPEFDQGPVEVSFRLDRITMMFKPSESQQADLDALLGQLQNPSSPNYHRWLTAEQFADRFGLSPNDLAKITSWLEAQGFTIDETARSRRWVVFSGTAQQVESAFHTPIHRYVVNGETHYANAAEPSVPSELLGMVLGFRSLQNFRPKPRSIFRRVVGGLRPDFTSTVSGDHFLAPDDFATIYNVKGLYNAGIDGTGQKIAVMGQTDIQVSDITAFRAASGLSASNPTIILIPGGVAGISKNDIGEADLDIEWAGGIARNASIVYVNGGTAGGGAFDALQYAVNNNTAPVISISYGDCERDMGSASLNFFSSLGQQANAQGITILAPGGDNGAADCDFSTTSTPVTIAMHGLAVDAPASIPEFTGIGGSEFNEGSGTYWSTVNNSNSGSALSYIPEVVWNTTVQDKQLAAGGGGKSIHFSKPCWQTGAGVPNDGARDVPDISFSASADHDGYLTCSQGSCVTGFRAADGTLSVVGGTSIGPPVFAGIVALINQQTNSSQGNVNPILYALATRSPAAFHDITAGNNQVPCRAGTTDCPGGGQIGYTAGPGYDQASGLGSTDAFNLASAWTTVSPAQCNADFGLSVSPTSLMVTRGGSGSATLSISAANGFSGTVNLTCTVPSTLTGTTCSLNPKSVATQGSATLTVAASTMGVSFPVFPKGGPLGGWWQIGLGLALGLLLPSLLIRRIEKLLYPGIAVETRWAVLLGLMLLWLVAVSVSCGGGSSSGGGTPSPPAGQTAMVTVQAASGSLTHSVQISVTVN